MNTKTIKNKSLGIILSLVLVLSMAAIVLPAPVNATVLGVTITAPVTATPAYAKTGGTVTVYFSVSSNTTEQADFVIQILQTGTSTVVASTTVNSVSISGSPLTFNYDVTLTGVVAGNYDVKVRGRQPTGSGTWVDSTVQSNALTVDNTAPVVTLTQPNGGEYVHSANPYNITWNATDAIPATANVTVTAEQSIDGGTIWSATNITNVSKAKGVSSEAWSATNIPDVDNQLARIRLTVTDDAGNATVVTSASNFTILNTAPGVSISIPTTGTSWNGASSQTITFTTTSALNLNVDYMLEFSTDGATWSTITSYVTNQPVGLTTYPWTVNNTYRGSAAKIRATVRDKVLRTTGPTESSIFTIVDVTAPTVTVTTPAAGAKLYNDVASNIIWTANDNVTTGALTSTWYLSTDGGGSYALIATSTDAQGTLTKPWTPTGFTTTQTNCKIKVTAADAATTPNTGTGYSGTFSIYVGVAPTVTVSAPATSASWQAGTCQTISWTTTYATDPDALLTILIEVSDDGGTGYSTIVTLPNQSVGSGSLSWAVDLAPQADCMIKVTAIDPALQSGSGTSGLFTITAADIGLTTGNVPIAAGWNLVSLQLIPTCTSIPSVLAEVMSDNMTYTQYVNSVWYFTGGPSGTWQSYAPGAPSSLTTMEAGKAYWVNMATGCPADFTFQGRKCAAGIGPPPSYSTVAGWNMVGYKSTTVKTIDVYLGTCPSTSYLTPVYEYTGGVYVGKTCGGSMVVGKGYWVYYNIAGTVFPGCD